MANRRGAAGSRGVAGSAGNATSLLAVVSYDPVETTQSTTSPTLVDVDAANLVVTFDAPSSGEVLVRLSAAAYQATNGQSGTWGLREGSSPVAGSEIGGSWTSSWAQRASGATVISGLTPGQSYTWKWAFKIKSTGTFNTRYGGDDVGAAVMEVWEVAA